MIDARDEADRANRAKSAFLAAASHDLRQPLQTLTLLNAAFSRIADSGSKLSDIARGQAQALSAMSELLNSLLDISKLEAGAIAPDIEDCLVKNVFERLQAQFSTLAEAKGLQLLVDECDDVVRTDPTLLEQIVQNLIANAIRYTKQGLVQLRCLHHSTCVQIEVVDTGIGIPANELILIFDEFYQAPRQPGQGKEGLGLGLSIVRRLADLLALNLEVDSTPGSGSRFTLNVPRGTRTENSTTTVHAKRRVAHTSKRIVLVVDDDDAVANATAMLLETDGYRPLVARDLETAQSRLAEMDGALDLIICDFHLSPGPTGVETIGKLREMGRRAIPAVLVTGDTSTDIADMADRLEKCRVLSKPIDADELLAHLQELFE
jgi:CheY-like chemotaxis protein/anti-sigma regulatory factor (Ser/Thr protein kinase)